VNGIWHRFQAAAAKALPFVYAGIVIVLAWQLLVVATKPDR
jgi:hypothetical protein